MKLQGAVGEVVRVERNSTAWGARKGKKLSVHRTAVKDEAISPGNLRTERYTKLRLQIEFSHPPVTQHGLANQNGHGILRVSILG